jgi:glycosyltransferase involved in cell wall biosynthesis
MIGARAHYVLPVALQRIGALARLYTDAWAGPLLGRARMGPRALQSLAARRHADIPGHAVVAFTANTIRRRLALAIRQGGDNCYEEQFHQHIAEGRDFALRVNRHLERTWRREASSGLIGYTTGCLETLKLFREDGRPTIVDQIDAARVHEQVLLDEQRKWPGWQMQHGRVPAEYWQRLEAEWQMADRVMVNSDWTRRALLAQGVNPEKIVVIPLAFECNVLARPPRTARDLVVLYVGRVVLEKGIPYLFEAARQLLGQPIRFIVAGPISITAEAVRSAPANVNLIGPVTRDRVSDLYRSADLFVLPTMSDGFAITQLEAMAHGLPVIATPNCGEVVSDGEDGRIVPAGDSAALAAAIDEMTQNRLRLQEMSRQASQKAKRFGLDSYACRLGEILCNVEGN